MSDGMTRPAQLTTSTHEEEEVDGSDANNLNAYRAESRLYFWISSRRSVYSSSGIMKRADRAPVKDTAIPTQPNLAWKKVNSRPDPETLIRKNPGKSLKGPSARYGFQSDVKEQNRLLVLMNEDLQKQVTDLKESVSVLEQRCGDLQENNTEIKKQLGDCHVLLITENLDPVSGEKFGEAAEQKAGQRKELMTVSQNLFTELKLFEDFTNKHRTHLTEVQNTMRSLKGAREKLHKERESFCMYAESMERALEDAERLLIE